MSQQEEIESMQTTQLESAKVSLKSVYAIIVCTIIILSYLTAIKSSVSEVGHSVDMVKQASDNDRAVNSLKIDILQKQVDGNSRDIKQNQSDIEQLKLKETK